jgi:hypothetical protein
MCSDCVRLVPRCAAGAVYFALDKSIKHWTLEALIVDRDGGIRYLEVFGFLLPGGGQFIPAHHIVKVGCAIPLRDDPNQGIAGVSIFVGLNSKILAGSAGTCIHHRVIRAKFAHALDTAATIRIQRRAEAFSCCAPVSCAHR